MYVHAAHNLAAGPISRYIRDAAAGVTWCRSFTRCAFTMTLYSLVYQPSSEYYANKKRATNDRRTDGISTNFS